MAANVDSNIANWSTTASSNQPDGSDTADLNAEFQQIQAVVRKYFATKGSDIASASTVDLSTATGNYVHITGTTTITALGAVSAGIKYLLVFDGALTFTHNATSLIIPGGANITTAAGDRCEVVSLGSGNWRILWYTKASGAPIGDYQPLDAELTAIAGLTSAANKVPMFSGSGTATVIDFLDEDNMASDSATAVPSQQSVNARINNVISSASAETPVASEDYFIFEDATDSTQKKALISTIVSTPITLGTAQNSTSGTSIDFTGIPSGANRIVVMFSQVSTSGTSNIIIQLGDSGGVETTGYTSSYGNSDGTGFGATSTSGLLVGTSAAADTMYGQVILNRVDGNNWVSSGNTTRGVGYHFCAGNKTLSGEITSVRITTAGGSDTFDAGVINIQYEL